MSKASNAAKQRRQRQRGRKERQRKENLFARAMRGSLDGRTFHDRWSEFLMLRGPYQVGCPAPTEALKL